MKKIIIACIVPLFFVMIVWLCNFQFTYGDLSLLTQSHLDLKSMLERFTYNSDWNTNFAWNFRNLIDNLDKVYDSSVLGRFTSQWDLSTGWSIVIQGVSGLFDPVMTAVYGIMLVGHLIVLVFQFLAISSIVATAIFDFIFDPIFIVNGDTYIPPIINIPDIPPIINNI